MNSLAVNDLSFVLAFALVLIAVFISSKEKLHLSKDIFLSIIRAIIQLILVGYLLKYIFQVNNGFLTVAMSLFIVFNAAWNAYKRNPGSRKKYRHSFAAIFISTYVTLGVLFFLGRSNLFPRRLSLLQE
jgi:putative ABC transport system permease protein